MWLRLGQTTSLGLKAGGSFTETVATAAVVSAGGSPTAGSGSVIVDFGVTKYRLGLPLNVTN